MYFLDNDDVKDLEYVLVNLANTIRRYLQQYFS
jgi:hypothetical protein